ncbi:MAG: DUF5074 domain-containing protein [Muribaculaceae bacterium]|nr:DUF5074 domain-containing protein [Muribaculaceae bacterium]
MNKLFLNILCLLSLSAFAETDYSKGIFIVNEDWYGHQNSTVNFLMPDNPDGNYWEYRVIQKENPGIELGCTNQFGAIWHDKFYFIAKQAKDPGASVTGGRITVADARTMKVIFQSELIDPSGAQCDGRGFIGVDEHKGYISSSNGVWIFDLDTYAVKGMIPGTDNPNAGDDKPNTDPTGSLYFGQSGSMVMASGKVFLAHQQAGVIVIDPVEDKVVKVIGMDMVAEGAGIGSVIVAKDGSVWASVAKDTKGTGSTLPFLIRIDPISLASEVIPLEDGFFPPSNSWYAWTPDTFCASSVTNTLYWSGGSNSWFSGKYVYKFDILSRKATKIIDLDADGEDWKVYGCSMRLHPVTDELYVSLYRQFSIPTYITRRYDCAGNKLKDYQMISNYWFPSIPVFPQSQADDSGVEEIFNQNVSNFGTIYNLQGYPVKLNVEYGKWDNLSSGLYFWKNANKTHKIIIP